MSTAAIPKPPDALLTPKEAAKQLRVKVDTLAVWRCKKRYALPFIIMGSRVFYHQSAIDRAITEGIKRTVTSKAAPRKRRA